MGFFFSKASKAKRPPSGGRKVLVTKANAPTLHRLGCAACPLDKADCSTPKMAPTITDSDVFFLGWAPGADEDQETGRPMTGDEGRLLRTLIPDGIGCSFDHVINCRPPKDRAPNTVEIECCRPRHVKAIEAAEPQIIVGLGKAALELVMGTTNLKAMRGRFYAVKIGTHKCWFLPTYDPAFIIDIAYNKKKPLNSKMGHCFRMDVKKAFTTRLGVAEVDTPEMARAGVQCFDGSKGHADLVAVLKLISEALKAPEAAIDLETNAIRPYRANAKILSVAISYGSTNFAFAWDHPKARWTPEQKQQLKNALICFLASDTIKIAHNAPFEIEWFIFYFGKEVIFHDVWECTQLQAHFLDERRDGQSLDDLIEQHFGLAFKALFPLDKRNMEKEPLSKILPYNGADTKYTLRLWYKQDKLLESQKLLDAYYDALPRQAAVALMQHFGVPIDQEEVRSARKKLTDEISELENKIDDLKVVKAFKKDRGGFNPFSPDDLVSIFKDYLKIDMKLEAKRDREGVESEGYSLDKNALENIEHPLAQLVVQIRNRNKMKSTYVDSFAAPDGKYIYPDGYLHPNFNTTFTETGRTSSDQPNQQNWPKRADAWVRKQIKAPKGQIIVAFDYGQLQACTAAMCSKDPVFVKALWEDYDTHMEWAIKLDRIDPQLTKQHGCDMTDPKSAKKYRSLIKNKLVFPAIFGATTESITGYLSADQSSIEELMEEFWDTFSGLKRWQDDLMKTYWEHGYVSSPVGRLHRYPITRNQAINFPVQAAEAEIVCDAMTRLSIHAADSEQWHLHPIWNIHDDLGFIIPDEDKIIEDTINHVYKMMLRSPYDWINVPLAVEASIGTDWSAMEDIGKFWSHKDL